MDPEPVAIASHAYHWGVYFGLVIAPHNDRREFRLIVGAQTNQPHPDDTFRSQPKHFGFIYYVRAHDSDDYTVGPEMVADAGTDWWSAWTTIVVVRQNGPTEVGDWLQRVPEFRDGLDRLIAPLWIEDLL